MPTGPTGLPGVQNFPKPYLPHPKSKSDVPYMHFDRLDESYAMVKSNLQFEEFNMTGLGLGQIFPKS